MTMCWPPWPPIESCGDSICLRTKVGHAPSLLLFRNTRQCHKFAKKKSLRSLRLPALITSRWIIDEYYELCGVLLYRLTSKLCEFVMFHIHSIWPKEDELVKKQRSLIFDLIVIISTTEVSGKNLFSSFLFLNTGQHSNELQKRDICIILIIILINLLLDETKNVFCVFIFENSITLWFTFYFRKLHLKLHFKILYLVYIFLNI